MKNEKMTLHNKVDEIAFDVTHNTGVTLRCASKRRFQHFSQATAKGLQGDVAI